MERKRLNVNSVNKMSFIVLVFGEVKVGVTRNVDMNFSDG